MARVHLKFSWLGFAVKCMGILMIVLGVVLLIKMQILAAVVYAAIGFVLFAFAAPYIADAPERKAFNMWTKQFKKNGMEALIGTSYDVALKVYQANPCKRTVSYIKKFNPDFAKKIMEEYSPNH